MEKLVSKYLEKTKLVEDCKAEIIAIKKEIDQTPLGKALAIRYELLAKYHSDAVKAKKRLDKAALKQFEEDGNQFPHPEIWIRTYSELEARYGLGENGPTVYVISDESDIDY